MNLNTSGHKITCKLPMSRQTSHSAIDRLSHTKPVPEKFLHSIPTRTILHWRLFLKRSLLTANKIALMTNQKALKIWPISPKRCCHAPRNASNLKINLRPRRRKRSRRLESPLREVWDKRNRLYHRVHIFFRLRWCRSCHLFSVSFGMVAVTSRRRTVRQGVTPW